MTASITLPICLTTLIILVRTYFKNTKHLWYQSEFILMLLNLLWINLGQLGFAIFCKSHGSVPGDCDFGTYCLYNRTYNIVLISRCTTKISVGKTLIPFLVYCMILRWKIATNLVFWLFMYYWSFTLHLDACQPMLMSTRSLQSKRYCQLAFTAANIAQGSFNLGFACNLISIAVCVEPYLSSEELLNSFNKAASKWITQLLRCTCS